MDEFKRKLMHILAATNQLTILERVALENWMQYTYDFMNEIGRRRWKECMEDIVFEFVDIISTADDEARRKALKELVER